MNLLSKLYLSGSIILFCFSTFANAQELKQEQLTFAKEIAKKSQLSETKILEILREAKYLPNVVAAIKRPAERLPWYTYKKILVSPKRIKLGVQFMQKYELELKSAYQKYGVPPEIIAAILGVETFYGSITGKFRVLDALNTLAFYYPPRAEFFKGELSALLQLAQNKHIPTTTIKGSYAGAMGAPQFMPSSYQKYAVSSERHEVPNLNYLPDAIESIANYLKKHGWEAKGQIAAPTERPQQALLKNLPTPQNSFNLDTRCSTLKKMHVKIPPNCAPNTKAGLIALTTRPKHVSYWVGFNNFYVITRYNHSTLYAMAVNKLADSLRKQIPS